jgi:large subunit ribosomal protein L32
VAVPKKRTSVSRKGLRRAGQHHKMYRKHTMECPNCGEITMLHHTCPSCGHYRGKVIPGFKASEESTEVKTEATKA